MTHRDRKLEAFDRLAVEEMDDIATFKQRESARAPVTRPVAHSQAPRAVRSAWSLIFGTCAIGLVFLAARR